MPESKVPSEDLIRSDAHLSRRQFLARTAGVAGVAMVGRGAFASDLHASLLGVERIVATGGTLVVAEAGEPATLDPHRSTLDVLRHTIRSTVFETLTWVDPTTLKVQPKLAKSWQISPDGKQVTFKLQSGVTWHDGTPFTAHDVAFTVKRVQDPSIASQYASQVATVKSVDVLDNLTCRFNLSEPTPPLLANLLQVSIVSQNSVASITKKPIGTGPFSFVEWVAGDHWTVAKNSKYWMSGRPLLDQIIWKDMPNDQTRLQSLRAGQTNMIDEISATDVAQVKSYPGDIVFASKPINLYEIFQINTQKPPMNDVRVRQALSYAFPRQSYVSKFWYGYANASVTPFVPQMPAYLASANTAYGFNLTKAGALLNQAGFSKQKPLTITIVNPAGYDTLHDMSILLQANLNSLGHKVSVQDLEISAWIDTIATHPTFDVTTDNYNTVPEDPAGMFNSDNLAPKDNINRWNPPGYANLVNAAASETNPTKRIALYKQLQGLLLHQVPMIVVDHIPIIMASGKNVQGLVIGSSGLYDWSGVSMT